jgi:hypothetical protein
VKTEEQERCCLSLWVAQCQITGFCYRIYEVRLCKMTASYHCISFPKGRDVMSIRSIIHVLLSATNFHVRYASSTSDITHRNKPGEWSLYCSYCTMLHQLSDFVSVHCSITVFQTPWSESESELYRATADCRRS